MWEQILAASLGAGAVSWPRGRVLYFEPNDDVIPILRKNISGGERSESHQSKSRLSRYRSAREEDRWAFPRPVQPIRARALVRFRAWGWYALSTGLRPHASTAVAQSGEPSIAKKKEDGRREAEIGA